MRLTSFVIFSAIAHSIYCDDVCLQNGQDLLRSWEVKLYDSVICKRDYIMLFNGTGKLLIKLKFNMLSYDFDYNEEIFHIYSGVNVMWNDPMLKWNPADYGGLRKLPLKPYDIWTPTLSQFNAAEDNFNNYINDVCYVFESGLVSCMGPMKHSVICKSKLTNWPYDTQNCTLTIGADYHEYRFLNFTLVEEPSYVGLSVKNNGWRLLEIRHLKNNKRRLDINIVVMRSSVDLQVTIVAPAIVLAILTSVTLCLDYKTKVRLALVCVSLYSHVLLTDNMMYVVPQYSDTPPNILLLTRTSLLLTVSVFILTIVLSSVSESVCKSPMWIVIFNDKTNNGPGKYLNVYRLWHPLDGADDTPRTTRDWKEFCDAINSIFLIIVVIVYVVSLLMYLPKIDSEIDGIV